MEKPVRGWTLGELAELLGGSLVGPSDSVISHPAPAGSGSSAALTFAGDEKHLKIAEASEVGAVLVGRGVACAKPCIEVDHPKVAFGQFLAMCARPLPLQKGVHETAIVDPRAYVSPSASVGPYAVIERGATVGEGCRVYAYCYVGEECHLDENVVLFPHVVLYQDVRIGPRSIVHAGTVIGADGFGYVWDGKKQQKVPQVGGVVIGPDCEIGGLSTIDRATAGDTVIGADTKLDNLVQVGHNTRIGEHTVVASGVGISGSVEVGDRVMIAGMVGIGDHVKIADDVRMAGRSATTSDVLEAGVYAGFPPRPLREELRNIVLVSRLPEMVKQLRALEQRIAELESKG